MEAWSPFISSAQTLTIRVGHLGLVSEVGRTTHVPVVSSISLGQTQNGHEPSLITRTILSLFPRGSWLLSNISFMGFCYI